MGVVLGPFLDVIAIVIDLYFKVVIIEVVLNWLIHLNVLKLTNDVTRKIVEVLERLTHPVYMKIRSKIPTVVSNIDFSPLILILALYFLGSLVFRLKVLVS